MTRPGQPEDLDDPRLLWTRASVLAVAAAAEIIAPDGSSVDDDGVAGDGWRVTLAPDGEAVVSGRPPADRDETGESPDLLDGLPERLTWKRLRDDMDGGSLGYVYWYADDAWHRAEHPDDALAGPPEQLADDDATIRVLTTDLKPDDENGPRAIADVLAKARANTLRPADVTTMLGVLDPDVGSDAARTKAALDTAVRTGLLAGTKPPLIGE
ncbi:hypothetical protein [Actinomadura sp. WMMB 499]|uniref:hypothetical protein n=1 Tax=Actinomadura sp. WMMB 499 TaxID=1219491 RepID=UPI001245A90F|nr:hypothetical protein [Actinomadura sp. WMMB 499]QFG23164.1 hypothetical protein F7P10_20615 [Actinomadura sp. WMMB 499]